MAYQLYKKLRNYFGAQGLMPTDISITQTAFGLGTEVSKDLGCNNLEDGKRVEVYIDKETNKIGFKISPDETTGFKPQKKPHGHDTGKITYIGVKKLTQQLPRGRYAATKEGDMWVITVPDMPQDIEIE